MRQPIIAANWKLHKTIAEARQFVAALSQQCPDPGPLEVVIAAPFTALAALQEELHTTPFQLAAQDLFWENSGAYTGEVSAPMLLKLAVTYVIIGHSERREYFSETDEWVNRKVKASFDHDLLPIMCVGETLAEREADGTEAKVEGQVLAGLAGVPKDRLASLVIAYEPIWAIGTGRNAYPEDAQATISLIRATVRSLAGEVADEVRIQYGGSVKAGNIAGFMAQPDIDGALVGGASLDPDEFALIVRYDA